MSFSQGGEEDAEYLQISNDFDEVDPAYFSYHSNHATGDTFQNLSKSDYAKVIFCDLYYNIDSTVGCRFQITDHVHEDPCDYIGLFRVAYENLSQCLASKMLSQTECEEDGKLLRCTFKSTELPELENGFYQFLYVTRDNEVCGASMPFQIKNSVRKDLSSEEDVVADNAEDDFLIVRSNMAERNQQLQATLNEMTEKCEAHVSELRKICKKLKEVNEEKMKLEHLLKQACEEKISLFNEIQKITEEKNMICTEKEEAIRILKEKNKIFSSMFDNYSDKLKEFTELKDALEADKNLAIAENTKLQERIQRLTKDLEVEQNMLRLEKEKNQELSLSMRKESSVLHSQLEDAKLMIEVLEKSKALSLNDIHSLGDKVSKLQGKLKDVKCENLILKSQMAEATAKYEKLKEEKENVMSELAAVKLHLVEIHQSKSAVYQIKSEQNSKGEASTSTKVDAKESQCSSKVQEECIQTDETCDELKNLKIHCDELHSELDETNERMAQLKEDLVKANGVVEYLTKEKESLQKNESLKQQALDECILRLNEASKIYKKQFRKIEKLKKKLENDNSDNMEKGFTTVSSTTSCFSSTVSEDEVTPSAPQLPQNQNSDSDTGEHVVRHPANVEKQECSAVNEAKNICESISHCSSSSTGAKNKPASTTSTRVVPELQTLIEMNLEKLKNSKEKKEEEDQTLYCIPCPVCDQDIGVYMSSTEDMVKHLEMQHKQQLCPICGRLFDMTLPPKYFMFHVEDHFIKGEKN